MKFKTIITILLFFTAIIVGYMFIEPYWIETKQITIESDQIPSNFDGKKIVYLSDIHAGPFFSKDRVDSLVNQVNALHPDLILLGGDYVSGEDTYINSTFDSLNKLQAPLGIYAVLGNTDPQYYSWMALRNSPTITDIGNMGDWVGNSDGKIRIGGVGADNDRQDIDDAVGNATASDFVILLKHEPDYFTEVNKSMVDLVLSGHTHGGQVTFFGLWAPYLPEGGTKYRIGTFKEGNSTLIVSNGIGTVGLPIRFFARPQIIVITLKKT
ncbi:MAG TPA: metallophosphoesterase [Methanobacterium sp.]|nr:metallophosphoesterase [Methanobacterium sp.]